ncbi:hypothetical protein GALL_509020 [mine drainage metagenome]|uniref:Uncharacterized protein n=1 Tax=mine drainage metagenome TaxID=410659 RepID=A0A1J5PJ02_9ZZZZ
MGVAEVMDIGAGGVEESGAQRIDALGASDHGRLSAARKLGERAQCDLDRAGAAPGEGDGEEIHQGALGLMPHLRGNVVPPRCNNVLSKALGHAGFVQHCYPHLKFGRSIAGWRKSATGRSVDQTGNLPWRTIGSD